jgi:hypothetical protein
MQVGDLVKEKGRPLFETSDKYAVVIAVHEPRKFSTHRKIEVLYTSGYRATWLETRLEVVCK